MPINCSKAAPVKPRMKLATHPIKNTLMSLSCSASCYDSSDLKYVNLIDE